MFLYIINLSTKESPRDVLSLASGVRAEASAQQGDKVNKGPFYSWGEGAILGTHTSEHCTSMA